MKMFSWGGKPAYFFMSGVTICLVFFMAGAANSSSVIFDPDGDGYIDELQGGDDCVDQTQAVFSEGTAACDTAKPPVFLDAAPPIVDHSWIQDSAGLYHMFFQNNVDPIQIEHYTSADLKTIQAAGVALTPTPGAWDSYGLWSPHVIKDNGTYYLFYTGVTGPGSNPTAKQRIGLATSTDLVNWVKAPANNCAGTTGNGCVYECNETWTRWASGGPYDAQCRDPFVLKDPTTGQWRLFADALLKNIGTWSNAVVSASSTNLTNWTGTGYIKASKRLKSYENGVLGQLTGGQAENPFITEYNGTYHLLFTDWGDAEDNYTVPNPRTMVQRITTTSLATDASGSLGWTYRGYTPDPGVNASEVQVVAGDTWVVSQSISNAFSGDSPANLRNLRLKRIKWNTDGTYTTSKLTDLACRMPSAVIHPGMPELCGDNIDNNCSGQADEQYCYQCPLL